MIDVYEITPAGSKDFTSIFVRKDETWDEIFRIVEESLEYQFNDPDLEWKDIEVKIKCRTITEDHWQDILDETECILS